MSAPSPPSGPRPRPEPNPAPQLVLCPYCGSISRDAARCASCRGRFDPLSRQATQNAMGPWWVRDENSPFGPGCSYETIRELVARGTIGPDTVLRGPTTNQFWTLAKRAPGVAHLLGVCHLCQREAGAEDFLCSACGAGFSCESDRQHMGLGSVQMLPGKAPAAIIAAASDRLDRVRPSVQAGPVRTASIQPDRPGESAESGPLALIPRSKRSGASAWLLAGVVAVVAGGIVWATLWATVLRDKQGATESAGVSEGQASVPIDRPETAAEPGAPVRADHRPDPRDPGRSRAGSDPSPADTQAGSESVDQEWMDRVRALVADDTPSSLAEAERLLLDRGVPDTDGLRGVVQRRMELLELRALP